MSEEPIQARGKWLVCEIHSNDMHGSMLHIQSRVRMDRPVQMAQVAAPWTKDRLTELLSADEQRAAVRDMLRAFIKQEAEALGGSVTWRNK